MRVYLDTCVIQRPFDDQTQLRIRAETDAVKIVLALCGSGSLQLITSDAHAVETARCPYPERRAYVEDVLALAPFQPLVLRILRRAERYREVGIGVFDALHLAAAVEANADVFCTADDALLARGQNSDTAQTGVLSPLSLVLLLAQA